MTEFYSFSNYRQEDKNDLCDLYYGDIKPDKTGDLFYLPYTVYSDYSGGTVERSNCEAIWRDYGKEGNKQHKLWLTYGGYGTTGIVAHKSILTDDDELSVSLREIINELDQYPLYDEDYHSELELKLEDEAYDSWIKFDLTRMLDDNNIPYDEDTLEQHFWDVVRMNDIYFICEDAIGAWIKLEDVIEHWNSVK